MEFIWISKTVVFSKPLPYLDRILLQVANLQLIYLYLLEIWVISQLRMFKDQPASLDLIPYFQSLDSGISVKQLTPYFENVSPHSFLFP